MSEGARVSEGVAMSEGVTVSEGVMMSERGRSRRLDGVLVEHDVRENTMSDNAEG